MRVLIVSRDAEPHLWSSTAQNTRMIADALTSIGWEVIVVCGATEAGEIDMGGWIMYRLPTRSQAYRIGFLSDWLPNPKTKVLAESLFNRFDFDVVYVGAWNSLLEFGKTAIQRGIPVIQMLHDWSAFCLNTWFFDYASRNCTGPDAERKCRECITKSVGRKDRVKSLALSIPLVGRLAREWMPAGGRYNMHIPTRVRVAFQHMKRYRDAITLYILQSPNLQSIALNNGIPEVKCRQLPQYIGRTKLIQFPRSSEAPVRERPVRFVYVGRWSDIKGCSLLKTAYANAKTNNDTELWVVSRNLPTELKELCGSGYFGAGKNLKFFDSLEGEALSRTIAQADVCIVPSLYQDVAVRVVFEAHAQRVPVITTDLVGNNYVIRDSENGRIIPAGDADALQRSIEEISDAPEILEEWSRRIVPPPKEDEWLPILRQIFEDAAYEYKNHPQEEHALA